MVLVSPCPDETLVSVLARVCRINGVIDFRDLPALCLGERICPSFVDAQISFPEFCRKLNYAYGDAVAVLENFTWLGAQVRIGEINKTYFQRLLRGELTLSLGQLMFSDSTVLNYCEKCRRSDIQQFGVAYWHRVHQLPVVFFCPHHGDKLVKFGFKRSKLYEAFPLPGDFDVDWCIAQSASLDIRESWQGLGVFARDLLSGKIEPEVVEVALIDDLRTRELVTIAGAVRKTELHDQLMKYFFVGQATGFHPDSVRLANRITQGLDPGGGIVGGRAALLFWAFGNLTALEERCNWIRAFGFPEIPSAMKSAGEFGGASLRSHHRAVCLNYVIGHPDSSRLEFAKLEYRSFQWLLHNDEAWLDRKLPMPAQRIKQRSLF